MRLTVVRLAAPAFLLFTDLSVKETCGDRANGKCSPNAKTRHCDGE